MNIILQILDYIFYCRLTPWTVYCPSQCTSRVDVSKQYSFGDKRRKEQKSWSTEILSTFHPIDWSFGKEISIYLSIYLSLDELLWLPLSLAHAPLLSLLEERTSSSRDVSQMDGQSRVVCCMKGITLGNVLT